MRDGDDDTLTLWHASADQHHNHETLHGSRLHHEYLALFPGSLCVWPGKGHFVSFPLVHEDSLETWLTIARVPLQVSRVSVDTMYYTAVGDPSRQARGDLGHDLCRELHNAHTC